MWLNRTLAVPRELLVDIVCHHIEGVLWAEAFDERSFPKAMLEEWEGKKSATPPGGKVYLAVSPGRGDLKLAEKAGPLPKELAGKAYDDPLVKTAYLNSCRRALEFFNQTTWPLASK